MPQFGLEESEWGGHSGSELRESEENVRRQRGWSQTRKNGWGQERGIRTPKGLRGVYDDILLLL